MSDSQDQKTVYDDVDDVIALAEELRARDAGALSAEEMREVGAELDIPPEYIERARRELEARRARDEQEAVARGRRRRTLMGAVVATVVLLAAGFGIWSYSAAAELRDLYQEVESHRAEVVNMEERKAAIEQQFADRPDSLEKEAQLVGSENRLRVALQRYHKAAAAYNRQARDFPASLWTGDGLPRQVELSAPQR